MIEWIFSAFLFIMILYGFHILDVQLGNSKANWFDKIIMQDNGE